MDETRALPPEEEPIFPPADLAPFLPDFFSPEEEGGLLLPPAIRALPLLPACGLFLPVANLSFSFSFSLCTGLGALPVPLPLAARSACFTEGLSNFGEGRFLFLGGPFLSLSLPLPTVLLSTLSGESISILSPLPSSAAFSLSTSSLPSVLAPAPAPELPPFSLSDSLLELSCSLSFSTVMTKSSGQPPNTSIWHRLQQCHNFLLFSSGAHDATAFSPHPSVMHFRRVFGERARTMSQTSSSSLPLAMPALAFEVLFVLRFAGDCGHAFFTSSASSPSLLSPPILADPFTLSSEFRLGGGLGSPSAMSSAVVFLAPRPHFGLAADRDDALSLISSSDTSSRLQRRSCFADRGASSSQSSASESSTAAPGSLLVNARESSSMASFSSSPSPSPAPLTALLLSLFNDSGGSS
mmetsp:Transcript_33496/g.99840  ORF Transcript_33496/g.99840 Transcript_33496/m.99840 type:complete len:410 (+) Transcript_33496:836-2065(+)